MSQPASACTSAIRSSASSVSSFSDHPVAHQPVVAVGIVGIERHVEQHADLRHRRLDRAGGAADEVLRVPGLGRLRVLVGGLGIGKERDAGDAERRRLLGRPHGAVDAQPLHPGHRGHRLRDVPPLAHEDRPDQVGRREPRLGHQVADPGRAAQPARAGEREGGERGHAARPGGGPGLARAARPLKRKAPFTPFTSAPRRVDGGGRLRVQGTARRVRDDPLSETFAAASFQSIWYWVLHVVVWTLACYRTLGVPLDMLHRARTRAGDRRPRRRAGAARRGAASAASTTSSASPIAALGRLRARHALRRSASASASRWRRPPSCSCCRSPSSPTPSSASRSPCAAAASRGAELVLALARRRVWHQFIAILAMFVALGLAHRRACPAAPAGLTAAPGTIETSPGRSRHTAETPAAQIARHRNPPARETTMFTSIRSAIARAARARRRAGGPTACSKGRATTCSGTWA